GRLPLVRRHLSAQAGVRQLFPVGAQRRAFPGPLRPPPADLVLRADPAGRPPPSDSLSDSFCPLLVVRRGPRGTPALSGIGIHAPGRRLVCAVLLAVGLQIADVHLAGLSPFGAGLRFLCRGEPLGALLVDRWRGRLDGAAPGRRTWICAALVCLASFPDGPARGSPPPLCGPPDAHPVSSPQPQLGDLLSADG